MYVLDIADRRRLAPYGLAAVLGLFAGLTVVLLGTRLPGSFAVAALGGTIVVAAIFLYPSIGLYLSAFVIPLERLGRFTDDSSSITISIMRMVGMLTLASFALHALAQRKRIRLDTAFVLYGAYWCFTVLTLFYTSDPKNNIQFASSFLGNLLFFFLLINMVRSFDLARALVMIWLAASVLIGGYTVYDWYRGESFTEASLGSTSERFSMVLQDTSESASLDTVRRAVGPTSNPAVYGINLIMTLPFVAFFYRVASTWKRKLAVAGIGALLLYNIFLTNTRAAFLVAVLVAVGVVGRRLLRVTVHGAVAGCIVLLGLLPLVPAPVYDRAFDISNYSFEQSETLQIRVAYWKAGLRAARDHPLVGTGVGNFDVIPQYLDGGVDDHPFAVHTPHNEYLTSLVEVGVLGWLALMAFLTVVVWHSFNAAQNLYRREGPTERYWFMVACQLALIAVLVFGIQVDVLHFPLKGFWLVVGLTCVLYRLSLEPEHDRGAAGGR